MEIYYTKHAKEKFEVLRGQGFSVTPREVEKVLREPEFIDNKKYPVLIAQRRHHSHYVLRVVFKKEDAILRVITFYPSHVQKYDNEKN